ncbi:MAG: transposase [Flavobacterium sp. JAD_PAG50586_2]|nr:MAG: transposase [Flavobacterium sp. JAD_PAG50586_2]
MILSDIGKIIEELFPEVSKQFPEVKIGEYIIMPDHLHIIVRINDTNRINDENSETRLIASLQSEKIKIKGGITGDNNPMFKNGIPRIIRWFKGRATFEIRRTNKEFSWQPRYYDRIIRDSHEYNAIIQYIKSNPANWDNDM